MPELAGTHDMVRDETDKESFIRFMGKHVNSISAVLVFVDPEAISFITDYSCFNVSTIFPKTLVNNIAFAFTKVQRMRFEDQRKANIRQEDTLQYSIPGALKSSPVFILDNPIVGQRTHAGPNTTEIVKGREQGALEILVEFFNWVDGLEPKSATEIISLYEVYRNIEIILDQRVQEVEIDRLTVALKRYSTVSLSLFSHLAFESYARWM